MLVLAVDAQRGRGLARKVAHRAPATIGSFIKVARTQTFLEIGAETILIFEKHESVVSPLLTQEN